VEDVEWLQHITNKGWVGITKDQRIRYNPLERRALLAVKARCFILVAKDMDKFDMSRTLMKALPAMNKLCTTRPAPFIARIGGDGSITKIEP
jgi:hypothetical protein